MTQSLDDIHRRIIATSDSGLTRSVGKPPQTLDLNVFESVDFLIPSQANAGLKSGSFESFLLDLRPLRDGFEDDGKRRAFEANFNSIAEMTKPYISGIAGNLVVPGIDNSPVGFGSSKPISTIEWIMIAYAQEYVAKADFGYFGPLKCSDLMTVLEAGRLPCAWVERPFGSRLGIY